jgi:hypothetical protein
LCGFWWKGSAFRISAQKGKAIFCPHKTLTELVIRREISGVESGWRRKGCGKGKVKCKNVNVNNVKERGDVWAKDRVEENEE